MRKVQQQFKTGEIVICLKSGKNNSDMIAGNKYTVSEVDVDGMIKLKGHPDWWSPERFKKVNVKSITPTQSQKNDTRRSNER